MNLKFDNDPEPSMWDENVMMPELAAYATPEEQFPGYSAFDNVPYMIFYNALNSGVAGATEAQNIGESPSIQQFLDIASKASGEFEVVFSGYRILPPRDDVRVVIEAIKFKPRQGGIPVDLEEDADLDPNAPNYDQQLYDHIREIVNTASPGYDIVEHLISQFPILSSADEIGQQEGYVRFWWD